MNFVGNQGNYQNKVIIDVLPKKKKEVIIDVNFVARYYFFILMSV